MPSMCSLAPFELTPWVLCLISRTARDGSSPLATNAPVCTGAQWMLGGAAGIGAEFLSIGHGGRGKSQFIWRQRRRTRPLCTVPPLPLSPQIMSAPHQIQMSLSLELLSTTHLFRTWTPLCGQIQAAPLLQLPALFRGLESKCPTTHHPGGPWGVSPLDPCPPLEVHLLWPTTSLPWETWTFQLPPDAPVVPAPWPPGYQCHGGPPHLSEPLLSSGCPLLPHPLEPVHLPQGSWLPPARPHPPFPLKTWAPTLRTWRWCRD